MYNSARQGADEGCEEPSCGHPDAPDNAPLEDGSPAGWIRTNAVCPPSSRRLISLLMLFVSKSRLLVATGQNHLLRVRESYWFHRRSLSGRLYILFLDNITILAYDARGKKIGRASCRERV